MILLPEQQQAESVSRVETAHERLAVKPHALGPHERDGPQSRHAISTNLIGS